MATEAKFEFKEEGLKVSLSFGTATGTKKFKSQAELDAAKDVYERTYKAVKAKKGAGSLKAELFAIFGIEFGVTPKTDKVTQPSSENKEKSVTKSDKPVKEVSKKETTPKTEKRVKTTCVAVGKNVTVVINGEKLTKKFETDADVKKIISQFEKIKGIEANDKLSSAQVLSLGKLQGSIKELMLANTIKEKKEKDEVDAKVKAIDKQMNKIQKKETVKVISPNKDIADILKEAGHELSDDQLSDIKAVIEKKKKVAPVATQSQTKRRGEY